VILLSPLLFLLHPAILLAETIGKTETLLSCLVALFMLTLYKALESNKRVDYFVVGGILGLASLVKSTFMLFPAFLFVYLLFLKRHSRTTRSVLTNVVAIIIVMLVILSPWIVRNYLVTGMFIPSTSLFGCSVYNGQYICKNLSTEKGILTLDMETAMQREEMAKEWGRPLFKLHYHQYFYSTVDEVEFDKYLLREALEEYRKSPSLLLKCPLINLFNFWFGGGTWLTTFLNMVVQLPYLILATIGVYLCIRRGQARLIGPIILFMAYYVSVHLPIFGRARYSVVLIPFLAVLSSIALGTVWDKRIAKKESQL
jgi:4-amino-4-deoxy-L-arabinose transferase-like glycosyltransferase